NPELTRLSIFLSTVIAMQISDFDFYLPKQLIAHYPPKERSTCRLLCLNGGNGQLTEGKFTDILSKVEAGDLLVFNNTKVIPARLYGHKQTGGKVEILVERLLDSQRVLAHIKASKVPKEGTAI